MSIKAIDFIKIWTEFIIKITSDSNWVDYYSNNKKWSEFIMGEKNNIQNSPFGNFASNKYEFRYRKEDGLTDLSISSTKNFNEIKSLHETNNLDVIKQDFYYPRYYDILIEHENNIYFCYQEMIKLTYSKAKLKVLITYNENSVEDENYMYIQRQVVSNFSSVIKQANSNLTESESTKYLLLIGQKNDKKLNFSNFIFDINGSLTNTIKTN